MATLVLTVVGSAVGGPIGGAIGAAVGQQIDNIIFAPKARQGPRLKELAVQTSSYGTQIPAVFGAMRVAGTVIWATDLVERRAKSGGGKGRPATINYSYSVSMAVALSSRPIQRIGRIWADGNLLRGSAEDLKVDTQLRLYTGHEDQPRDSLLASAEAAGQCPAHRGIAYAVFEDLQLADYGNRIPSLTFEIFERDDPVPVAAIFDAATQGGVSSACTQNLRGFAVSGEFATDALGALLGALPIELAANNDQLFVTDVTAAPSNAAPVVAVVRENREAFDAPQLALDPASDFPHLMTLRYYDGERDFQASLQRSERGQFSRNAVQIELPAVLGAAEAKQIIEHRHLHLQYNRSSWSGDVAIGAEPLSAGDFFSDEKDQKWRIEQIEHRFGSAHILARAAMTYLPSHPSTVAPGRHLASPDLTIGETRLGLMELPVFGTEDPSVPLVAAFAAGTGNGWRRAALSLVSGDSLIDIGTSAPSAIMGTLLDVVAPHNVYLIDENTRLRVQLLNGAMDIAEHNGSPLDSDAPYCWLNGEFIRFGICEALGSGVFRLSRLRRGCFQSESDVPLHPAGTRFILVESDTARLINERVFVPGEIAEVEALGLADLVPVSASITVQALSTKPLAPVHGRFATASDGSVTVSWIRRSRIDAGWRDGVDQALSEQQEQYLVSLAVNGIPIGEWTSLESHIVFSSAQWAAFEIPQNAPVVAEIRQIGRHAQSGPLSVDYI
jgi:Putative phage tail protein